jgi:4'-phosphopantetheinyl transferase
LVPTVVNEHSNAGISMQPWTPGPRDPQLRPGAVDVWRVDLEEVSDDVLELLSAGESARAERMVRLRDRALWARSRGVLRAFLGRYLHADPRRLHFVVGRAGKPAIENRQRPKTVTGASPTKLSFNLSHSAQVGLFAFTTVGAVGVDVEVARRPIDAVGLAARLLGPAEAARLRALHAETRDQEFRRAWVRHEATLKCLGAGLGGSQGGETARLISELEMGPRAAAAVAVAASPSELRCWDWSGADQ